MTAKPDILRDEHDRPSDRPKNLTIVGYDDRGRPVADDGYPIAGPAKISEAVAVSTLSRSAVYAMLDSVLPTKKFGRSRRVDWADIRRVFLDAK